MGGYLHKPRPAAKPQTQGTDARSTAADGGTGQSPARSLLQLRQALDESPRVRQHAALQRALDQRAAPAKKKSKEKPALQMKGIAINDDVGLEREADVMGARARAMPQPAANGGWAGTIQRGKDKKRGKPFVANRQGEMKDLAPRIDKYSNYDQLKPGLYFEDLVKLINALEKSIPLRNEVYQKHLAVGMGDSGHAERIRVEKTLLKAAEAAKPQAPKMADAAKHDKKADTKDTKDDKAVSAPKKKLSAKEENKRAKRKEKRAAAKMQVDAKDTGGKGAGNGGGQDAGTGATWSNQAADTKGRY
jgi:hypothetical protein